jgi:hypothetical protein
MPDDPSAYGSYMNFFLPQSARVGPALPVPGLFDMLGGMGRPDLGAGVGTPEEQRRKQQEQQKQQAALAQQGVKMMQPIQPPQVAPPPVPVTPQQIQPLPQPAPATDTAPTPPRPPIGYDPRDPRSRNPMAGMPNPFGGFYR